jgi:hypothetical protein
VSQLPAWPSADLLLVNLDLTLPRVARNRAMRRQERYRWRLTAACRRATQVCGPRGVTHSSRMTGAERPRAWTGSWTGAPEIPAW